MDNLQRHYLQQLEHANEAALHGNLRTCLNICFELRLKSDLALWTRACVNITLANFTRVQDHPDKSKFALEALRLVRELKADNRSQNAVSMASYDIIEAQALELLEVARAEEAELQKAWEKEGAKLSDPESNMEDKASRELWQIEGSFSSVPVNSDSTVTASGSEDKVGGSDPKADDPMV